MMSRTFRYFKLFYIVAGILMSNQEICEHVDQFQITPRVHVKELLQPRRVYRGVEKVSRNWFGRFDVFGIKRLRNRFGLVLKAFSIWTIPNYLLYRSSSYISQKFIISNDCDIIYSK